MQTKNILHYSPTITMKPKNSPYERVAGRLIKRVIPTILVTMIVISAISLTLSFKAIKKETDGRYQATMHIVSEKLATILLHEEVSARNVIYKVWDYMDTPENVMASMEEEIKTNDYTHGYFFAFEPGFFSQYPRWFEAYMKRGEAHARNIGSASHDYLNAEWYKQAKTKAEGDGFWTDPYLDDTGGKDMVCSFCMPVFDLKERLVGVWGSDMSLNWLLEQLKEIDAGNYNSGLLDYNLGLDFGFYTFIISHDGTYISHPDKERILKDNVRSHVDGKDREAIQAMMQLERGSATVSIDGERCVLYYAPLEYTNWSMAIVVPEMAIVVPPLVITLMILVVTAIGLVIVSLSCRSFIRQIVSPLSLLADSAEEVAKGNFEAPLPTIAYRDEICELRDSFATMQQSLMTYMENLKEKTAKEAAINNELEVAHKLQMSMIPQKFPAFPKRTDIDLYGSQTPAKSIGGDLFDFFIRNEQLFFCIGDVSGKGIPAALVMTVIHHLFRIVSNREDDPKRIVEIMNESYAADNKSVTFCTFFLGVLDLKTRLLRYCNAGHEAPYLITGAEMEKIKVTPNLPLGLVETKKYEAGELQLTKDAVILLYTDGLTDATNKAEERFDITRVESALQSIGKDKPANASDYVNRLLDEVAAYVKDAPQADDLTLLAIKIK